ncbi:hypothetical protein B5X24_HaOG203940 [Helicoverpa armigera]|uniref:FLYWCH-type domain-containing protein n=1 Tax=Helicoverpa armigera TaxID=29058 RepID=A0A2W1BPL1_HELAM|nr:hypothetical protein B5X24_HaOG203940 [Helicoverpa armigera]
MGSRRWISTITGLTSSTGVVVVITGGTKHLYYEGYVYTKNSEDETGRSYWVCKKRKSLKCKAAAVTVKDSVVKCSGTHTHEAWE